MTTTTRPAAKAKTDRTAQNTCRDCAMPIPHNETLCPLCARKAAPPEKVAGSVFLNWLILAVLVGAIFGAGILLAP